MTVGLAPSINRKMVLVKSVQDQFWNTFRHGMANSKINKLISIFSKYSNVLTTVITMSSLQALQVINANYISPVTNVKVHFYAK